MALCSVSGRRPQINDRLVCVGSAFYMFCRCHGSSIAVFLYMSLPLRCRLPVMPPKFSTMPWFIAVYLCGCCSCVRWREIACARRAVRCARRVAFSDEGEGRPQLCWRPSQMFSGHPSLSMLSRYFRVAWTNSGG